MYQMLLEHVHVSYVTVDCSCIKCYVDRCYMSCYHICNKLYISMCCIICYTSVCPVEKPVENSQYPVIYGIVSYVLDNFIGNSNIEHKRMNKENKYVFLYIYNIMQYMRKCAIYHHINTYYSVMSIMNE